MAVALAWVLQRSPKVLLIPAAPGVAHVRKDVSTASLQLSADVLAGRDTIGR